MQTVSIGVRAATNEMAHGDKPVWFYSHNAVVEVRSDLNLKAHSGRSAVGPDCGGRPVSRLESKLTIELLHFCMFANASSVFCLQSR